MSHVDLFGATLPEPAPAMDMSAVIDGAYRYELRRTWDKAKPILPCCMLNPSTADHEKNDPTIRRLIEFATNWGYGGLVVVNLFAFRSPSPKDLPADLDRAIGPKNNEYVDGAFNLARHRNTPALAAWGNLPPHLTIVSTRLMERARHHFVNLVCLGTTLGGFPKHPMARGQHRVPSDQQPVMFARGL
ncbi:DUF1643 domain-containing protein [Rhizobium sp. Nf11,1]|uniref:DUF1643 domain-containing protein n=1 Tax=Rhizobium sp. Nf11,1 TaxID=3404923 RepID=UPI003D34E433